MQIVKPEHQTGHFSAEKTEFELDCAIKGLNTDTVLVAPPLPVNTYTELMNGRPSLINPLSNKS